MTYTPPLNGGRINVTLAGNSTSAGGGYALASTGTVTLAGGNNITLSQNANAITISGGAGGGGVALYDGAASITSGTASFSDANGVSFGINGQTVTGSVAAQTNQTVGLYALGNTTQNSSTTLDARTLSFNGLGINTVGYSNGSIQISASQSAQTQNLIDMSIAGNSTSAGGGYALISSGTAIFAGGNNITLSQNAQSITISAANSAAQTNQSLGIYGSSQTVGQSSSSTYDARSLSIVGKGGISVGWSNSSLLMQDTPMTVNGTSNSVSISGGNNITVGNNASTITISAPNQTNQTVGLYALGNTTQNSSTTLDARTLSFNGLGMITAGYSNGSIQLSATQTAQTQNLVDVTLAGNTTSAGAGYALMSSGTVTLAGGNNITLSQNANAVTISAPNFATATSPFQIQFAGNTAGAMSTITTGAVQFAGGNNVTLSQNAQSITISAGPVLSQYIHNSAAMYSSSTSAMVNASASLVRMLIPGQMSFSRVDIPVSFSGGTAGTSNTAAMALSAIGVIYSRNASTLNAIVGQSSTTTYSYASNTGVYSSITGPRVMSFNLATSLSAGEYYFGFQMSSNTSSVGANTTNLGWTLAPIFGTSYTALPFADISSATNQTINAYQPLQGMNSVTITNTSQTHQQSQITQTGATAIRANMVVMFRNV